MIGKLRGLRWYILALVALGTVVNYIDRNTLGILAPELKESLHFTTEQYSYVVGSFQLAYSLMQPIAGYITDFVGLKLGYAGFAMLWGLAAALHATAGGWMSMAGFRGMLGVSEAAAMPTGVKVSGAWFPPKERSIATGLFNTGSSVGAMIAPPLVVWLSLSYGWQWAFLVTGALGVGMSLLWLLLYRDPQVHKLLSDKERDYIGSGQDLAPVGKPSFREVLGSGKFWGIAAARFLTEPAWQTFSFWIPLYMVTARHMDIKQYALFGWMPFLGADLGGIVGGYLSPFLHKHAKMTLVNSRIAGVGLGAVCMIGPAMIGLVVSPITAIMLFALGAFAHQMLSGLLYALVTDTFEKRSVATATGMAGMFGYFGGLLFSLVIGQLANTIGYEPLFGCLSIFDISAFLVIAVVLGERGNRRTSVYAAPAAVPAAPIIAAE